MPPESSTPRAPSAPNPPHPRVLEARTRHLCGVVGDVELVHIVNALLGDLVLRAREQNGAVRFAIGRVGQHGGMTEVRLTLAEIPALVMAASQFRLLVSPPPPPEPRGRNGKRGAR